MIFFLLSVTSLRPLSSFLYDDSTSSVQPMFDARDNSTSMTPAANSGTSRNYSVHVPLAIDAGIGELNPAGDNDGLRLGYSISTFWFVLPVALLYVCSILPGTGDTRKTSSIAKTESAGDEPSLGDEKNLAKDMLRVKGRNILQVRRQMSSPLMMSDSVSDSSTVPSFAASNVAGIADPPLYYSRQYSSQRRASSVPELVPQRSSPVMIKIVSPTVPIMVDKETNTADSKHDDDDDPTRNTVTNPLQLGSHLDDADTIQTNLDVSVSGTVEPKNEREPSLGTSNHEKKVPKSSSESKKGKDIKLLKPVQSISANVHSRTRPPMDREVMDIHSKSSSEFLPIVDNQSDILVTRTYRQQIPDKTLVELMAAAENPLEILYQHYAGALPNPFRMRLLNATILEDRFAANVPVSSSIQQTLRSLLEGCHVYKNRNIFLYEGS